jgi:hypothetical protein
MPKKKKTGKIHEFKRLRSLASASSFSKIARFGQMAKISFVKKPLLAVKVKWWF